MLCDNTLFRVHTSILSTRSPALRQMLAQTSLATAGSPDGCPRILSSDTDTDFAILLKMMYHSGYVICPGYANELLHWPSLSTDSLNRIKRQTSPHSRPSSESLQSTRCLPSDPRYSKPSVVHIRRLLRALILPRHLGRAFSATQLTRTRSSTCLSNRTSRRCYRWHTTWRFGGVWIR